MDTAAIFTHFETLNTEENTVLLLSNHLYQTVSKVWSELPGVKLVYEPLSVQNKEFLDLLSTLDITIKCSNQDLLENLARKQGVVIGTSNLTTSFIKSAFAKGFNNFLTQQSRDVLKITNVLGNEFSQTQEFSKEETTEDILENVQHSSSQSDRQICVGTLHSLQELRSLKDRIMDLKWKLPSDVRLSVELGQEFFQSTFLIATKIIGKEILDGQTSYTVDMSMFEEFACYLDTENNFSVYSRSDSTSYCSLYGNTGDEEDLILEGEMGEVDTGDWILLGNAGLADCRGLDMILLDKDYRVVRPRSPSQAFSNSLDLEFSLLTVSA